MQCSSSRTTPSWTCRPSPRPSPPAPGTSARSGVARRPRTGRCACARPARPRPTSSACTPRADWTSAPRRWRRPRSRCSPRSSRRGRGGRVSPCARPRARSAATTRTLPPSNLVGQTEIRRDLGSPDPKQPREAEGTMDWTHFEQLRVSGFTMTRRGYDKREVDRFLDSLAEWLETDAANELGDQAVQRKLELVGKSTAHILLTTEKESQELKRTVQAECDDVRQKADAAAKDTRRQADEYSSNTRTKADEYSANLRAKTEEEAERTKAAAVEKARKTVEEGH